MTAFKQVDFTIDFAGSTNFTLIDPATKKKAKEQKIKVSVPPYERLLAAHVELHDYGSLKYSIAARAAQPDKAAIEKKLGAERATLDARLRKAFATRSLLAEPTLDAVRDQLAKRRASEPKLSFIDLGFRPQAESIDGVSRAAEKGVQGGAAPKGKLGDPRQYSWKRPPDFLGDSYQVFVEGLIPSDVCQGSLGNCWFMCSLASLAEFPHLIEKLYESSWSDTPDGRVAVGGACEHGAYEVTICKNGAWTPVRVDDFFPCRPGEGNGPVFSRASGPELWVLLMEKAYAKLHGSYFALRSGVCFEGLMDLTGAPTFHKEFEREAVTFEMLQGWDLDNFVVCCSTPGVDTLTEGGGKDKKAGLVPGARAPR